MELKDIIAIIQVATGIAQSMAVGTKAKGDVATIAALEDIIEKTVAAYMSEVGQPMDLSKFQHEEHAG